MEWHILLSTLFGGAITFAATVGQDIIRGRRAQRAALMCVAAEVGAAVDIIRARGYRASAANYRDMALNGELVRMTVALPKETIPCCRGALKHSALQSGALTMKLARWVMMIDGLVADFDRLYEHDFDQSKSLLHSNDIFAGSMVYSSIHDLLLAVELLGDEIVSDAVQYMSRGEKKALSQLGRIQPRA